MAAIPVIAIFDVGKTNKKLFLFNEQYEVVHEQTARFTETKDEDGFPCDNLESLRLSVYDSLRMVFKKKNFCIKAINFATYGASFVYIDEEGLPLTPLYNYLKPYPAALQEKFYAAYGGEAAFAQTTASPVLGSLNSGMQLYRLKQEQPQVYKKVKWALHLPQYMSYLITGTAYSDITSIGCHTNLWDFEKGSYHEWVKKEGIHKKLAPLIPTDEALPASFPGNNYAVGVGVHDSSAALIPYLVNFQEPFALLSTGTWCITLNPFNNVPLTRDELTQDCLCYLNYKGQPVKASRLFAGHEYDEQVKRIADYYHQSVAHYRAVPFDADVVAQLKKNKDAVVSSATTPGLQTSLFGQRDLKNFKNDTEAYHQLVLDLVEQQCAATKLVTDGTAVKRIFVDGGFSKNGVYMNLLAAAFPQMEVFAASMAQGTALGAALALHKAWNTQHLPSHVIDLKYYALTHQPAL